MEIKNKIILVLLLVTVVSPVVIRNNITFMLFMADSFSSTSVVHKFFRHRVFRILENENLQKDFEQFLVVKNSGDYSINLKAQVVGVAGVYVLSGDLLGLYIDYQKDKTRVTTVSCAINSLGLMGAKDATPILERLLDNYDNHNPLIGKYEIARSLYLITGRQYPYVSSRGETTTISLTAELIKAREAIKVSEGRQRKYEEMLSIDEVLMPPENTRK